MIGRPEEIWHTPQEEKGFLVLDEIILTSLINFRNELKKRDLSNKTLVIKITSLQPGKNTSVSKRLHCRLSFKQNIIYKIISIMEFLPREYSQGSADLIPKGCHCVIGYVMGLTKSLSLKLFGSS